MELLLSSRTVANAAARHCLRVSGEPGRLTRAGKGYRHRGETRQWFLHHATISEEQAKQVKDALPYGALIGESREWEDAERAIDHEAKEEVRYLRPDTEEVNRD